VISGGVVMVVMVAVMAPVPGGVRIRMPRTVARRSPGKADQ
jgi:hypothetical protein